ncbi:MAG: hypothetical protein WCX31_06765 [Salinivirgaceae bacterium]
MKLDYQAVSLKELSPVRCTGYNNGKRLSAQAVYLNWNYEESMCRKREFQISVLKCGCPDRVFLTPLNIVKK